MIDYTQFTYAKRDRPDTSEHNFRGYALEDWKYSDFTRYQDHSNSEVSANVRLSMYENHQTIAMPWNEVLTLKSMEVLAALPVVLSFEIDIDTDRVPRFKAPSREFHITVPVAECANVTKFIVAHNRHPGKYKSPENLGEWRNVLACLDPEDYTIHR